MDRKIALGAVLILLCIAAVILLNKFGLSAITVILLALIGISSVFFSRGILIFLTLLCLIFIQSQFRALIAFSLTLRWIFFALFFLHVFGDIFLGRTVRKIKFFDVVAIFFIIYAFASFTYSPFPQLTLERATTIFALYISVFWIIWKYAYDQGPEKVVSLMLRVVAVALIMSYLMLFIRPQSTFVGTRFTGIIVNPNGMGMMCAIFLPLSLWQYLEKKKKRALILFLFMLLALFLSGNRGSMNAAVVALGYFLCVHFKKYRPLLLSFSIALILILTWVIELFIKDLFKAYIRVETIPILGGRLEIWPLALNLFIIKPIFGYGFGVEDQLIMLQKYVFRYHQGTYVHNCYLGMLLQLGIIGFILFFVPLFILLFKELFQRQDAPVPTLRYALRSTLITGLICSIYESWVYSVGNAQTFPFWIAVMLLVFYRYQEKQDTHLEST